MMFNFESFWKVFLILNHVNDCQVYEDTILINLICIVKEAFENFKYGQFRNQVLRFKIFGLNKRIQPSNTILQLSKEIES